MDVNSAFVFIINPLSHLCDSRRALAKEFFHVRFFEEMFRTFELEQAVWLPLSPSKQRDIASSRTFPDRS